MNNPPKCPNCGVELPADAPAGLCPECLVAAGIESEAEIQPEKPKSDPEAPTKASPPPSFEPPEVDSLADKFPQLEILELLGHGGMGAVYKARQTNLDRLVALKIIRPEATLDSAFAVRFNREAKTLARLSHQHIVAVHDFGEVEYGEEENQSARPLYYFLMEFVDGANLRQLMSSGDLSPEQALAIVPQVCDALQFAHDEGVVHRDIKPENILLDKRGRVKIADFGLAKLATRSEAEFTLTGTHQVMGTLRYMAPEQMEGSHAVDHRADIYSLGVVFYEMLTGEVPAGIFDPPSKKVELDVRLDEVVLRSLAREPERRYQHASDVKTDVESISSSEPLDSSRNEQTLPRQQTLPPGMGPRLLLYSGMMLFSSLVVASGIALVAVAFLRESPGSPPFWGWMGGAFGCLFGGLGALSGTWNSYRQLEGAPDLWNVPHWTILDRAMLVYTIVGVVMMASAWFLSSQLPWYPVGYSLALTGGIVLFQGVLFLVIRGLLRRAAQQEQVSHGVTASHAYGSEDERQREADLAEIAPDWLCYLFMVLFGTGWILVGLLWNFRWPGLWLAIGVMAAITYYAVQWKLRYLPSLRKELERYSRWTRGANVTSFLIFFALAMLSFIAFQGTLGDMMTNVSLLGPRSLTGIDTGQERIATVEKANLEGLTGEDLNISPGYDLWTPFPFLLFIYGFLTIWIMPLAVATLIHTRRYRYSWKYWWGPSLSVTVYLLGMLVVVHVLHLFVVGYRSFKTAPCEIHFSADWKVVDSALDDWTKKNGYKRLGAGDSPILKGEDATKVGYFQTRLLAPESWFDRYQASWRYVVLRPQPPMYLTVVTRNEPVGSYVRIELPQHAKDSPEKGLWAVLVDDLEATIRGAASKSNGVQNGPVEEAAESAPGLEPAGDAEHD